MLKRRAKSSGTPPPRAGWAILLAAGCSALIACARPSNSLVAPADTCASAHYDRTLMRHTVTPVHDATVPRTSASGLIVRVSPLVPDPGRAHAFGYVRLTTHAGIRSVTLDSSGWVRVVPADTGLTIIRAALLGFQSLTDTVRVRAGYLDSVDMQLRLSGPCLDRVTL